MITSTKNEQVKRVIELKKRAKTRDEEGLFVVEGSRMLRELPAERTELLYVSESYQKSKRPLPTGPPFEVVSDSVFAAMSDTKTPQGVLALVRQYAYSLDELLAAGQSALLMVLENIQDPGNLGTILRAGEGAGITGVLMSRDTADIYNPKVIRSTMGSVFRMPFLYAEDFLGTLMLLKEKGVRLYAADLSGERDYEAEDYRGASGFLIGNEGNGLRTESAALADSRIRIPMEGRVESLNAAVAASVLMFEAARQRRAVVKKGVDK
ncbi:MAG: RNA methyltransferase [Lachnospiraceae bacterium]|nr:RNA methyltransferase [Lachnospiraceae bacterium]